MNTMSDSHNRGLGTRIKLARKQAGFSEAALAKRLGTSTGRVGQLEIGRDSRVNGWSRRTAKEFQH
jgi:transcriptional regulator with XRE-family HTH domain